MEGEKLKVHVLIRQDLGMGKGKICSQAAHAVLGLYKDLFHQDPMAFAQWASLDFEQETYQANSDSNLYKVENFSKKAGIHAYVVHDAGRTQIAANTPTVCAFGPASEIQAKSILESLGIQKLE